MFQKEFAQKLCSKKDCKEYGYLTCYTALYFEVKYMDTISRVYYDPRPRVDSAFIHMKLREKPLLKAADEKDFLMFMRKIFTQRRKQIGNCLQAAGCLKEDVPGMLKKTKISTHVRPEDLTIEQFVALFKAR
jgi:16S rRNA (adenine1518-N6/adenine1519-N6)-dimethyltransferase